RLRRGDIRGARRMSLHTALQRTGSDDMRRPYLALRGSRAVATAACAFLAALAGPAANAAIVAPSQCVRGSESVTCTLEQLYQPGAAVTVDLIQFRNWHFIESDDALDAVAPGDVSIVFSESGRRI